MKKSKPRAINEVKVKLLPEKAKRDYVLRFVSYIIILVFVILNFLMVYIPRNNLTSDINKVKRRIANIELKIENAAYIIRTSGYTAIFRNNNDTVNDIENSTLDLNKIFLLLDNNATFNDVQNLSELEQANPENFLRIKPEHSFVEYVSFKESDSSITVTIQFDQISDLFIYQGNLLKVNYVSDVKAPNYTLVPMPNGDSRVRTTMLISLDIEKAPMVPKVGESNE